MKTRSTVSIAPTEEIRSTLGLTPAQFSAALGYHRSAYTNWLKAGACPTVAALAAKTLLKERRTRFFLLQQTDQQLTFFAGGTDVAEATIAGKTYFLIPKPMSAL